MFNGIIAVVACLIGVTTSISFHVAYASLTLHVASSAIAGALAAVAAAAAALRIGRNSDPVTVLLAAATGTTAVGIWAFELVPLLLGGARLEERLAWGHATSTIFAALAFLLTAASPMLRVGARTAKRLAIGGPTAALATSMLVVAVLPARVRLNSVHDTITVSTTGGILPAQAISAALFATAAALFLAPLKRGGSPFLVRLGLTSVLFACSRLVFFQVPSVYAGWVSLGDLWRILGYGTLTAAIVGQLRLEWADDAVRRERTRVARQIHGGLAQDLAFLLLVLGRSTETDQRTQELEAARKAMTASRALLDELAG